MNAIAPVAEPVEIKKMTGLQKAAVLMLALGRDYGWPIWEELADDEIKELSAAMAQLGAIPSQAVEHLFVQFATDVSSMSTFHGSYETTQRLLESVLPTERVREVMEDIRGPHGRTMWDKLGNVNETVLAAYLEKELPQTSAIILLKLKPDHAARVLAEFNGEYAFDVIDRMLRSEVVQKDFIHHVEQTLRSEFMSNLARTQRRDPHETMAEIFNSLTGEAEGSLLSLLEARRPESAERIRALMFTFQDLVQLAPAAIQTLLRYADKTQIALALKGSPEPVREIFYTNMSDRGAKILREDIEALGPVRQREVLEAQTKLVRLTKQLADKGEISIDDNGSPENELVY